MWTPECDCIQLDTCVCMAMYCQLLAFLVFLSCMYSTKSSCPAGWGVCGWDCQCGVLHLGTPPLQWRMMLMIPRRLKKRYKALQLLRNTPKSGKIRHSMDKHTASSKNWRSKKPSLPSHPVESFCYGRRSAPESSECYTPEALCMLHIIIKLLREATN